MQRHADALQPWQRMACKAWKEESSFAENHRRPQCTFYRVFQMCEDAELCDGCASRKAKDKFSTAMWQKKRAGVRYCLCCATKAYGLWTCSATSPEVILILSKHSSPSQIFKSILLCITHYYYQCIARIVANVTYKPLMPTINSQVCIRDT